MNVPMTAAPPADNDGNQSLHHHPSQIFDNNIPTLTPINQQEWEDFYNEFVQFVNLFNTVTPRTNNDITTPTPTIYNGVNNTNWLLVDDNNTHNPNLLSKQDSSPSMNILSGHSITGLLYPNTATSQLANNNDCYHISPGHTANEGVHHDTLSTAPLCPDNECFDYKAKLKEINNACHQMMRTMATNNDNTAPMAAIPDIIDSDDQPHVDDITTPALDWLHNQENSPTESIHSVHPINAFSLHTTDNSNDLADNNNSQQILTGNTAKQCMHLATLSTAPPSLNDESFNYKVKLKEIDDACTQLETYWTMAWNTAPTALQPGSKDMTTNSTTPEPTPLVQPQRSCSQQLPT